MSDHDRAKQIELILSSVDTLPMLSPLAARFASTQTANTIEIQEIARIIETDPALSARILGLCRRADKGAAKVAGVRRAVVMLGVEAVRSAVLAADVCRTMGASDLAEQARMDEAFAGKAGARRSPAALDLGAFWHHSVSVACGAEILAQSSARAGVASEEAFLAGMMHDVGKVAINHALPKTFGAIVGLASRRGCDFTEAARVTMGVDQIEIGVRVADRWALPESIRHAIRVWRDELVNPGGTGDRIAAFVGAAYSLTRMLYIGSSGDFGRVPDVHAFAPALGIAPETIPAIVAKVHEALADRMSVLGLGAPTSTSLMLKSIERAHETASALSAEAMRQARSQRSLARAVDLIAEFQGRHEAGMTEDECLRRVVADAHALLGGPGVGLIVQRDGCTPMRIITRRTGAGPIGDRVVDFGERSTTLGECCRKLARNSPMFAEFPKLAGELRELADVRLLRMTPLLSVERGLQVALIHCVDLGVLDLGEGALRALLGTWQLGLQEMASEGAQAPAAPAPLTPGDVAFESLGELRSALTLGAGALQVLRARSTDPAIAQGVRQVEQALTQAAQVVADLGMIGTPPRAQAGTGVALRPMLDKALAGVGEARLDLTDAPVEFMSDPVVLQALLAALCRAGDRADDRTPTEVKVHRSGAGEGLVFELRDACRPPASPATRRSMMKVGVLAKALGAGLEVEYTPTGRVVVLTLQGWRRQGRSAA